MAEVYTITSGESDDDLPSVAGAADKGTFDQMDHESHPDKNIEVRLQNEVDMTDFDIEEDNNLITLDDLLNSPSHDRSSSPDVAMELEDNAVEQKSAGSQKSKKKSKTGVEKQTKKQKTAEEKLAKKASVEINKMYKPGECMKHMNLEGHPSLWSRWYMADVPREVAVTGAHIKQTPSLCNPGLLVWTRTIPRTLGSEGGQVKLSALRERCDRAVLIADAEELCEMVSSHTLSPHVSQIRQLCDCKLTLIAFNVNGYFKKKGRGSQNSGRSGARRKTSNSNRTPMTEIDFQLATTDLLVSAECDTLIANSASELAQAIVQLTKAIAEAPAKKAKRDCDDQARFYMRGDNKNCIVVDKNGVGVGRLWQQMLAILPQSSLETSRAICAQYKSPLALYESLQSAPAAESIARLADVGVSRAAGPGSRARRVGPELARKLHTLFTATNGNQLIE